MNHFLAGAILPFLLGGLLYVRRRCRAGPGLLVGVPVGMGLGGLWALVPDLPLLWKTPGWYFRLHRDPRSNWFFWHLTLDRMEDGGWDPAPWPLVALVLMLAALMLAALRELRLRESAAAAADSVERIRP